MSSVLKVHLIVLTALVAAVAAAEEYPKPEHPAYPEPHVNPTIFLYENNR